MAQAGERHDRLNALEDRLDTLERENRRLKEHLDDHPTVLDASNPDPRPLSDLVSRRSALAALGFALLPAALADRASADTAAEFACVWLGNQDANGFQLDDLKEINFSDGTTLSSASEAKVGALSDSGSDNLDGGNQYVLPQAEDSIDLQSAGDIENAASIVTEGLDTDTASRNLSQRSATYIVHRDGTGANAVKTETGEIEYSGDTTTVCRDLADALSTGAGGPGGHIHFTEDVFRIDTPINVRGGITISGVGPQTRFIQDGDTWVFRLFGSDNTIKDLSVEGDNTGSRATIFSDNDSLENLHIENVKITGGGLHGIQIDGAGSVIRIRDVVTDDVGDDGIAVGMGVSDVVISDCVCKNSAARASPRSSGIEIDDGAEDVTVVGCHVFGNSGPGISVHNHTDTAGPRNVTIVGVIAYGNGAEGIGVLDQGGTSVPSDVDVIGCHCYNNDEEGVRFSDAVDCTVSGGKMYNNGQNASFSRRASGVHIRNSTDITVTGGVRCYDDQGTTTQDTGVNESGTPDYTLLDSANLRGSSTAHTVSATNSVVGDIIT